MSSGGAQSLTRVIVTKHLQGQSWCFRWLLVNVVFFSPARWLGVPWQGETIGVAAESRRTEAFPRWWRRTRQAFIQNFR